MTTFLEILTEIKELLLAGIPSLDNGYAYARQDASKGLVCTAGNDSEYVGINDVSGDYFYIRDNGSITCSPAKSKTDCSVANAQKMPCSVVAVLKNADEFKLTDVITNILLKAKVIEVKALHLNPVNIIDSEFKGLDKSSVEKAKSNIGDRTIVKVDFDITRNFETHNCQTNICKSC